MPHYRIYLRDRDGHIISVREVDCADDAAALAQAQDAIGPLAGAEVWQEARKVGQVSPRPPAPAQPGD